MKHLFKTKDAVHDTVLSSDNHEVECTYQGHPFYSIGKAICIGLHLVFLKYCPVRTRVSGSSLRRAIWIFFDFAQGYNLSRPESLQINQVADISTEVFNNFQSYLLENNEPISNAGFLKTALNNAASLTEAIPDLLLPYVIKAKNQPRAPLNDETDAALERAFTSHINLLYKKISFREEVHIATAYTYKEVYSSVARSHSRASIFQWMQHCEENNKKIESRTLLSRASQSPDELLRAFASLPDGRKKILAEFNNRGNEFKFLNPVDPFEGRKILRFKPDPVRVLKTLLDNGYPFNMKLSDIGSNYASNDIFSLAHCNDVVQLLIFTWRGAFQATNSAHLPIWDDLLGMYYPTMLDMSCLIQFIMLQTNWNKETVLALDPENYEHALTGAMNEEHVVLQSEKNRSQGVGKPYHAPKEIIAASTRSDKYSAWNLFGLANNLSAPLKPYALDYINHGKTEAHYNPAFLCIRFSADWVNKGGRHTSASNEKAFLQGIKQFLKKYEIFEDGEKLTSAKDLTLRLRPTWVKRRKQSGDISHGFLALLLGHNSSSTTDIHYDNSAHAQMERYDRLESELESIVALMYDGKFEGMLGTPAQEAVNLPFKVFHIPGMEKPLWACSNQKQPTWHGAKSRVKLGQKCYVVSKCIFCTQAYMFEDSLPYLMERRIHVVELVDDQPPSSSDYSNDLEIELSKIDSILDNWEDNRAIKEAARYQRRNTPLLPRDLNFLQVILEEEDKE